VAPGRRSELRRLHEQGIKIAIDDFGTGFSALGQLRRFPIDVIKVDRSFVQGIENDPRDAAITANVVRLAHSLGILAIAEGIETDRQLASARELGRPIPAHEMNECSRPRGTARLFSALPRGGSNLSRNPPAADEPAIDCRRCACGEYRWLTASSHARMIVTIDTRNRHRCPRLASCSSPTEPPPTPRS
jgi:EAL domain